MRTLRGQSVDRPPVSFYEIDGWKQDAGDPDPFNVYNHPSWRPLLELARTASDAIATFPVPMLGSRDPAASRWSVSRECPTPDRREECRCVATPTGRTLTRRTRRDRDVNTVWVIEPLVKDAYDLHAWLSLEAVEDVGRPDVATVTALEARMGEAGIVMLDTPDPLCAVAGLMEMADFTVMAMTEPNLMDRALAKAAADLLPRVRRTAEALPGRLWRIFGPEYASEPYLPPRLFERYAVRWLRPMVEIIHRSGGYARVHSHGRLANILDAIAATGCAGLDPVEPPPQGDIALAEVRRRVGRQMVLFGNIEASDLESLHRDDFAAKVTEALAQGTSGSGRGFVLMPSACPYGRVLSSRALENYRTMIRLARRWGG